MERTGRPIVAAGGVRLARIPADLATRRPGRAKPGSGVPRRIPGGATSPEYRSPMPAWQGSAAANRQVIRADSSYQPTSWSGGRKITSPASKPPGANVVQNDDGAVEADPEIGAAGAGPGEGEIGEADGGGGMDLQPVAAALKVHDLVAAARRARSRRRRRRSRRASWSRPSPPVEQVGRPARPTAGRRRCRRSAGRCRRRRAERVGAALAEQPVVAVPPSSRSRPAPPRARSSPRPARRRVVAAEELEDLVHLQADAGVGAGGAAEDAVGGRGHVADDVVPAREAERLRRRRRLSGSIWAGLPCAAWMSAPTKAFELVVKAL